MFTQPLGDESTVATHLRPYHIVCVMRERTPFSRSLFKQLPNLTLLVTTGTKNAAIDLSAASELGITVCGTDSPGYAASELAFGLILALARHIPQEHAAMQQGLWQTTIGSDLHGQTLGILGLGRHGANLARFGQAFGMRVIAWSQNLTPEHCADLGVVYVTKAELFQQADFLTIHLKLDHRNHHLVDKQALAWMKSSAYLVNTSRGAIVDETALIQALQNHTIAGAGLDVYDQEPLPKQHPFRQSNQVILTSHVGYVTQQTYVVFYQQTVSCIEQFLANAPVRVLN